MIGAVRVLQRHWRVFVRTWRHNLMYNVAEPLLYLAAMGFGLGALVQQVEGMTYLQFLAPGMVALSAMYSATFECTYGTFLRLYYQKTLQAILAGPVTVRDVVFGELLYGTLKSVLFGAVILAVVTMLGQIRSPAALFIPIFLFLPGALFSVLAVAYTGYIKNIDHLNYYITLVIMPFFLFGGLYFPVSTLPDWVQQLNWVNPLFHSVEVCRALSAGQLSYDLWIHVAVLLFMLVALIPLPLRLMKKRLIS
ncbi:MAG TPA: ABC transporter permease [Negativicutes bacterium]|nr:ABC transporter permease [Negativicutes bacterium]